MSENFSRDAHIFCQTTQVDKTAVPYIMKLSTPSIALVTTAVVVVVLVVTVPFSTAYSCGGYSTCRPNSAFGSPMRILSPRQRAELSRQQAELVNRAFEALADDVQKSQLDADPTNSIPNKQKEFVNKAVEFFTDMGGMDRQDAETIRDITNRGFEIVQDLASGTYSPAYEIQDKETEIEILVDVPGVAREDIDILFEEGVLKISGTRKMKKKKEDAEVVAFSRSFPVNSRTADIERISAALDCGVLTIHIPKKEVEKPAVKRIDIL
jgi:HSP20 family protein